MKLWHSIRFWRGIAISLFTLLCALATTASLAYPRIAGARYWLLDRAAYGGDETGVRLLLGMGASPDGTKDYPYYIRYTSKTEFCSHLTQAADSGNPAVVKQLLDAGADPNIVEGPGWTAIMSAAEKGHTEIVRLLLDAGADPLANHGEGSALDAARINGHLETAEVILARQSTGKAHLISTEEQAAILKECTTRMGLSFPKETKVLGYEFTPGMDEIIHLKIQVPSRTLRTFVASLRDADFSPGLSVFPAKLANQPWWRPAEISEPMEAEATLAPGRHIKLLYPKHPSKLAEIYLLWFET